LDFDEGYYYDAVALQEAIGLYEGARVNQPEERYDWLASLK